jgi:hypothetical protein
MWDYLICQKQESSYILVFLKNTLDDELMSVYGKTFLHRTAV